MAELLLELLSEEIPARMQARAAGDLKRLVTDRLSGCGLAHAHAEAHVTPRRLALVVDGLPLRQPDVRTERRGPRADAPERAIQGFLKSVGKSRDEVEERATDRGTFLFVTLEQAGSDTRTVLPELLVDAIQQMPWQRSMRWARTSFRWVRPLHQVLALFDGEALDGRLELGTTGIAFGDRTRGHRFLAPDPFAVTGFAGYRAGLRRAFVILDREERKRIIFEQATALAEARGLSLRDDPALLDEVAGLVEWPSPLLGRIDPQFMSVPPEVLVTAMRSHQKYFALLDADGTLAPCFVTVSNMAPEPERDATIVAGNEKVLRARLADARFFWDQDRAITLEERVPALADVAFFEGLGTLADRAARMEVLAGDIAGMLGLDDTAPARRGARLAKADLTTQMVGEFPELQGTMGRYYAEHDGEAGEVCAAIADHYAPLGPSDRVPTAPVSICVALADKLDTLVGFFAIGERPTGSRDPYALRRAALGVVRIIRENRLRLPLTRLIGAALAAYRDVGTADGLFDFIVDRLTVHLRTEGLRHDLIAAVRGTGEEDDLVRLIARVEALGGFLDSADGGNLLVAYRRASNIVRIEESRDGCQYDDMPREDRFAQPEEHELYRHLVEAEARLGPLISQEGFLEAMTVLAGLRQPVDSFFDEVTVNVDQPQIRENRLWMLGTITRTMNRVADFSGIEA